MNVILCVWHFLHQYILQQAIFALRAIHFNFFVFASFFIRCAVLCFGLFCYLCDFISARFSDFPCALFVTKFTLACFHLVCFVCHCRCLLIIQYVLCIPRADFEWCTVSHSRSFLPHSGLCLYCFTLSRCRLHTLRSILSECDVKWCRYVLFLLC